MGTENHWDREAENWIRWARTPGFDSYWYYRQFFFDEIVPSPGRRTLEIGCGEGRVTRDLAERGHHVIGLDASFALVRHAMDGGANRRYLTGNASRLPFPDESFSLVVGYNSLMNMDDMPAAVAEASRVLKPEGNLAACITHPIADAGRFNSGGPESPFVITGSYLGERRQFDQIFHPGGLEMHFRGWCYPLESYARALEDAGFAIERLREPSISDEAVSRFGESWQRWRRMPMFFMFRAFKVAPRRAKSKVSMG